jgi:hypothetical protein
MARQPTTAVRPTYTGAWKASALYTDKQLALAPGSDPSHMRPDEPDAGQIAAGYPRVNLPPDWITEEGDTQEDAWRYELDTPGLVLDTEPITHDADDAQPFHSSPGYGGVAVSPDARAHMVARGRDHVGEHEEPQMRAADEEPRTERWEQDAIEGVSNTALRRGTNSLDENNPDGYRKGWSVKRFYHRRMPTERFVHTERWMRQAGAASAVDSPAFTPAQSNRYTSPFAWRSFYAGSLLQGPLLRRQPPESWSVEQTSDGEDAQSEVTADWVVD